MDFVTDPRIESLLGPDGRGQATADLRSTLALATRYLANWYAATKGSEQQAIWWQRIDQERGFVEAAYRTLSQDDQQPFPGTSGVAAYQAAADGWPQLYRDLALSSDNLPAPALINQGADFVSTLASAPGLLIPQVGEGLAKILGDTVSRIWGQLYPVILVGGAVGLVWIFREPLSRLATKAVK